MDVIWAFLPIFEAILAKNASKKPISCKYGRKASKACTVSGTEGDIVSETMAARGLVNGRGPCLRRCSGRWEQSSRLSERLIRDGRDSAVGA